MAGFLKKLLGRKHNVTQSVISNQHGTARALQEPDLTIARAHDEMAILTQTAINTWGLRTAAWNVDLVSGSITFTNSEMGLIVTAPVQVVGTFDTEDNTWLWGWDHPSVSAPLGEHARRVRAFGTQYDLTALTTRKIFASKDDAWEFTALACHLGGGQGGYSGSSGNTRIFMTYGTVTIQRTGQSG